MNQRAPILLFLALAGCATSSVERAEAAAQSMRQAKLALSEAPDKINAVANSLDELTKEGGDMKAEYAAFDKNVVALSSHRDRLVSLRKEIEKAKTNFLDAWEKRLPEIKDEALRKRAEERRTAVATRFGELAKMADSSRDEFNPWFEKVTNVRTYLENDLNPGGVASAQDQVTLIKNGTSTVNEKITTLVSSLDEISQAVAAAKPPAPAETKSAEAKPAEAKPAEASTKK